MREQKGIKIIVASHKSYTFPDAPLYVPIQVGAALNNAVKEMIPDNTGENISKKNESFCELTAMYWAWKNRFFDEVKFAGLVHYRRYFAGTRPFLKKCILDQSQIEDMLEAYDAIVPKKRHYYIETVYSHYTHAHYRKDLDNLEALITQLAPEYLNAFEKVMQNRSLHLYNMFVMRSERFYAYCEWLFPLLFELENRIDIREYDTYQKRVYGFLGERLFNVWLLHEGLNVIELPVANLEGENLIQKGWHMLLRKFLVVNKRR